MGSISVPGSESESRPHAVCIPYPAQGHVSPMMELAKLLHHKGFYITFVNTHYNHRRLLNSLGASALDGLPDFRFTSIPDGLPPSDADATQHVPSLCRSTAINCLEPLCELIKKLNDGGEGSPPVSCIVTDGVMSFGLKAAERFAVTGVVLWTASACGLLLYSHYRRLVEEGYVPLKDINQISNGYLDTPIDWVNGNNSLRLRDFPSFIRTTDPNDIMLNFFIQEIDSIHCAKALIFNTFHDLEEDAFLALKSMYPPMYTIGPFHDMMDHVDDPRLHSIKSSLWKEDKGCTQWLDTKEPGSVVYINFGSITVMTPQQLTEFAWGLANTKKTFLWIIRPDAVTGDSAMLPPEFLDETKERSMLTSWCPQDLVLKHPAIGGFLTHNGWNSTLESIIHGVPMICWPFFAEQQTNCRYCCVEWGIGMEIDNNVNRDEVEGMVNELMDGEKGKEMKKRAMEWKRKAKDASGVGGSSFMNLDKVINEVLLK